jgi:predicted amino acid-binding ACT domain protein
MPSSRFVISVLIADRAGILRDATTAVTDMGANIDGIKQTVVAGYFTVMLTASFETPYTVEDVRRFMDRAFDEEGATIVVVPYDEGKTARPPVEGERYIVTLTGADRRGIMKAVTTFLADRGINIEDWDVRFEGSMVTHVGQVTVPSRLDITQLQHDFHHMTSELPLHSGIQHENIFRAISEVGPIKPLVTRN